LVLFARGTSAGLNGPSPADRQITVAVATLMQRQHLTGHELDDEIAARCLKAYLESLDPMKLYFYQEDIDEFAEKEGEIDDLVKKGDITLAHTIFTRYLERLDERVAQINQLLDAGFDFTADEEMVIDRDARTFASSPDEAKELWRKRIKYDMLVQMADGLSNEEAVKKLRRRYESLSKRMHQTDDDELLEIFLTSLTGGFDPHSSYMSASTLENFEIQMRLELDGIGASLQFEDGYTVVKKIIPGGAADKDARLKIEDRIIGVGEGSDGEITDTVDMKLNDVVKLIRGKRGTVVKLHVLPFGDTEPKVYDITRAQIKLTDSEARSEIIRDVKKPDGTPMTIGVIDLPSFYMDMDGARNGVENYKSTTRDVRRLLEEFKAKGVEALVLDLRHNGGGSLTEAVNLTGLFIDEGPVVQVKGPDGRVQPYDDRDEGMSWEGPLVVLTSKFSASASEIFAGAIQDYNRGLIVGDKATLGKGTVQQLFDLGSALFRIAEAPKLGALKLTIQQFYRPGGDSTQSRGVIADIELPWLTTHLDIGESDQDYALDFDQVDALPHDKYEWVNAALLAHLKHRSRDRIADSTDFQQVRDNIERFIEQKERETVSLNQEDFLAARAELNAEKEEEKQFEALANPGESVVNRDHYFDEILAITGDYLVELEKNKVAGTN
jgi:carboxyl-terminal processing protease